LKLDNDGNFCDGYHDETFCVNLTWEDYKNFLVGNCEIPAPNTFHFAMEGFEKKKIGFLLKKRIDGLKKKYRFLEAKEDYRIVNSSIDIDSLSLNEIFPQIIQKRKIWKNVSHGLEKILDTTYSIDRFRWKNGKDQLYITKVVGPTMDSVKDYFIISYADTPRAEPLVKEEGCEGIGNYCFFSRDGELFSSIDFISGNALVMLRAEGSYKESMMNMAKILANDLIVMESCVNKLDLSSDNDFDFDCFCEKRKVKLGEFVPIILEVINPEGLDLHYHWKISGGGIEEDSNGDLLYYGSEPGKHTITITINNDRLIKTKYFIIKVSN
jgi:hypothetical protein